MYKTKLILFFFLCLFGISGYSQKQYYVSTLAGDTTDIPNGFNANAGYRDGTLYYAQFNSPTAIAIDTAGHIYVADTYNNLIREVNSSADMVTTFAGDTADLRKGVDSNAGYLNGPHNIAKFNNPLGVCVDDSGNVYVADTYNNVIRKISAATGIVSTYAGKDISGITFAGYVNGAADTAEFFLPTSLSIDSLGNLFVADNGNNAIREISASTHMVSTVAGRGPDYSGYVNGPVDTAEFSGLYGIALGNAGAIFATQFAIGVNGVRKVYHDTVTTCAGYYLYGFDTNAIPPFFDPIPSGYKNGKMTGKYDTAVLFNDPTGIAFDTNGNLVVADEYNNVLRVLTTKDSLVSTLAGNDSAGFQDGWYNMAEFYNPMGVAIGKKGAIYVADLGNNLIRKLTLLKNIAGVPTVNKPLTNTLNVYPNPCTDRLTIVSSFNGKADLLDVTGRVIWTDNNFKSPYTLSTSSVTPGVYFLRVSSLVKTEIRKIEIVK